MTYVPKTFTSGTTLPALALNDLDANVDHVREEAAFKALCQFNEYKLSWTVGGAGNIGLRVLLDGATYLGTAQYGTGAKVCANIAVAISSGLHYLQFVACRESAGVIVENAAIPGVFRFVKTDDLQYLTWWAYNVSYSASVLTVRDMCVVGHRTVQATWG